MLHVIDNSSYEAYLHKGMISGETVYIPIDKALPGSDIGLKIQELLDGVNEELAKYKAGRGKITYKIKVRQGYVVEQVLEEIKEYQPDLVVMCTHGWTGLKHLLMGSVTEKIVRLSPVPVLTTRGV